MDPDFRTRAAIEEHWRASEAGESAAEHAVYAEDAILDYPQSGERFRGRATIAAQRGGHPASRHFTVDRIVGHGDPWVSTRAFAGERVVQEPQYFADPFGAPESRIAIAEPMPGRTIIRG